MTATTGRPLHEDTAHYETFEDAFRAYGLDRANWTAAMYITENVLGLKPVDFTISPVGSAISIWTADSEHSVAWIHKGFILTPGDQRILFPVNTGMRSPGSPTPRVPVTALVCTKCHSALSCDCTEWPDS